MKTIEQLLLTKLPLPAFICLPGNCWFFGLAVAPQQNKASFSFENKERQTASTERPSVLTPLIWPLLLAGSQRFSIKMENNGFSWKPTAWWICPFFVRKKPQISHSGGFTLMQHDLPCSQSPYRSIQCCVHLRTEHLSFKSRSEKYVTACVNNILHD